MNLNKKISLRLTQDLFNALKHTAISADMKLADFIRTAIKFSIEALDDKSNKLK